MIVLGINGLLHDASVCLIRDGRVLGALEHERVTRFKNGFLLFPFETIHALLREHQVPLAAVDCVSWNFAYHKFHAIGLWGYVKSLSSMTDAWTLPARYGGSALYKLYQHFFVKSVLRYLFMGMKVPKVIFTPHHLGHFWYSYYASSFSDCAALILDGGGEYTSTTLLSYVGGKLETLHFQGMPAESLGIVYSVGTHYLGFKPSSDEYKVMGLASFGKPNPKYTRFFERLLSLRPEGRYKVDQSLVTFPRDMLFTFTRKALRMLGHPEGSARWEEGQVTQEQKDFAYALQKRLEEVVLHIVRYLRARTGSDHLLLGGGVFLNASLNGVLRRSGIFKNVFVPPAPHDAGTSIGAAIYASQRMGQAMSRQSLGLSNTTYLGSSFSDAEIEETLVRSKLKYDKLSDRQQVLERTVDALCEGRIVGWFQGRMEFGPRALGNRSILADPRGVDTQAKVNRAIKNREDFRPFAPSVLEECMEDIFEFERWAPHMISIDTIREHKRALVPAVTHVDGTGRPQSVRRADNPLYYDLISQFYRRTGVPLLLNTSFNYRDEPIVRTPEDAVRSFHATGLDVLVVGNYWLQKDIRADALSALPTQQPVRTINASS